MCTEIQLTVQVMLTPYLQTYSILGRKGPILWYHKPSWDDVMVTPVLDTSPQNLWTLSLLSESVIVLLWVLMYSAKNENMCIAAMTSTACIRSMREGLLDVQLCSTCTILKLSTWNRNHLRDHFSPQVATACTTAQSCVQFILSCLSPTNFTNQAPWHSHIRCICEEFNANACGAVGVIWSSNTIQLGQKCDLLSDVCLELFIQPNTVVQVINFLWCLDKMIYKNACLSRLPWK